MDFARARFADQLHDLVRVVPRTTLSSIRTTRLFRSAPGSRECFILTPSSRMRCVRLNEGAADIMVADDAKLERKAAGLGEADRGGNA